MELEAIKKVIAEQMDIDAQKITLDSTFEELDIDSLDMVEIVMALEEELDVSLEELEDVKSVKEVVYYIKAQKG